jgi:outer membrane protein
MKKFGKMALVAVAALAVVSCNNEPKDNAPASNDGKSLSSGKIAYVVMDSINNQYAFAKDCEKILKEKEANIEKTLSGKQQTLQAAAANFQQKLQNNGFQSREQAAGVQAAIERQQRIYIEDKASLHYK